MVVYSVSVQVEKGREEDFKDESKKNRKETRKESGNIRFDILQDEKDPSLFMLLEVYRSDEAVMAHKATKHYKTWRDAVAPWMARDRQGTKYKAVDPVFEGEWSCS
jgi:(4S)-4-hydroxy-5-phosphonooxypentane-2,3-dione isomerase